MKCQGPRSFTPTSALAPLLQPRMTRALFPFIIRLISCTPFNLCLRRRADAFEIFTPEQRGAILSSNNASRRRLTGAIFHLQPSVRSPAKCSVAVPSALRVEGAVDAFVAVELAASLKGLYLLRAGVAVVARLAQAFLYPARVLVACPVLIALQTGHSALIVRVPGLAGPGHEARQPQEPVCWKHPCSEPAENLYRSTLYTLFFMKMQWRPERS